MPQHVVSRRSARVASIHAESLVMICAPAAKRSSFRDGRQGAERLVSAARTAQMITSLPRGSKVFEVLEGGAAARKAGRRKLNVFARWAIRDLDLDMGWP